MNIVLADGGEYAFETYMEQKNIAISFGNSQPPQIGLLR